MSEITINPRVMIVREAITRLVPILSGRNIRVTQAGSQAFCEWNKDGTARRINLPYLPDDASDELITAVQGFLDHEVGHALFTDPKATFEAAKLKCHKLHNILEDPFIERKMGERYTGAAYNMRATGQMYLCEKVDQALKDRPDLHPVQILLVPIIRAWSGQDQFQTFMKDKWHLVEDFTATVGEDLIKQMPLAESSWDTLAVAKEIQKRMKDFDDEEKKGEKSKEGGKGEPDEEGEDDGEGEKGKKGKPSKDGKGSKGSKGKKDKGDDQQSDDADDPDDSGVSGESDDLDEEQSGEESDGDDASSDGQDDDGGSDGESKAEDAGESDDSAGGDDSGDDGDGRDNADDDSDVGEDAGGSGDEDAGDEPVEGDDAGKSDAGDGDGSEPGEAEGDSDDGEDDDSSGRVRSGGTGEMHGRGLGLKEWETLERKVEDYDEAAAEAISKVASKTTCPYLVYTRDYDVVETIECPTVPDHLIKDLEDKVDHMVGPMQKDLERAIAARSAAVWTGGHKSGRLHGAALVRIVHDRTDLFRRKQDNQSKSVAVSLVNDLSGSMTNEQKLWLAMHASYALSSTLERIGIKHEVIGFTTKNLPAAAHAEMRRDPNYENFAREDTIYMPIIKDFNERIGANVKKRFASIANYRSMPFSCQNNVDGESVQIAAHRLAMRPEKRKVMIVLSDGQPACGCPAWSKDRDVLDDHLKAVVSEIQKAKIDVVGIGINSFAVQEFYPKNVVLTRIEQLPLEVMRQLKALLVQ